jgi:hypothetical protein
MRCSPGHEFFDLRILISMSVSSCEGWPELLVRKRANCGGHPFTGSFSSRPEFVRALEKLADQRKEQNIQTNLVRLHKAYKKIEAFATAVGSQSGQIQSIELLTLVWSVSFAVITVRSLKTGRVETDHLIWLAKVGFAVPLKLKTLVDYITYLDDSVPHIDTCTEALSDFPPLQEPLQVIYARYIESHIEMIRIIRKLYAGRVVKISC